VWVITAPAPNVTETQLLSEAYTYINPGAGAAGHAGAVFTYTER